MMLIFFIKLMIMKYKQKNVGGEKIEQRIDKPYN